MLEEIVKQLQDRRIDKVAAATGLSRATISEIRDGKQTNPTLDTIEKLRKYFNGALDKSLLSEAQAIIGGDKK